MIQEDIFKKSLALFLAPIKTLLADSSVSEIMINGPSEIFVEKAGILELTELKFEDEEQLKTAAINIAQYVGKRITSKDFAFDARLPDGSRVSVIMPPCSKKGICISIRKFIMKALTLEQLVELGSMTPQVKEFIEICVLLDKNILVSGGTGSGKTSLLNAISAILPENQRVIVIEDSSELQLQQNHVLYFETRAPDRHGQGAVSIRDLFRCSLRQRPDRIIIGEVRGGEALDLIQALTSGHQGSMSTIHANSPRDALNRLETLALMSEIQLPLYALRAQVASALDIIIQTSRMKDGTRKIISISEVLPISEDNLYRISEVFVYRFEGKEENGNLIGGHVWTGQKPSFNNELILHKVELK